MNGTSNNSNFATAGSPSWTLGQVPNWRGGSFDGWRHAKARFALDFSSGEAMCMARNVPLCSSVGIARASERILPDGNDAHRTIASNALARVDGRGAFFGGQFTNKIRNPRGEGGIVGTVGVVNKCTGFNAAPDGFLTNTEKYGDAAAILAEVDDVAAIEALALIDPYVRAGLENGWLSGTVFRLDNAAGVGSASLSVNGQTGNTNPHSISVYVRGEGVGWIGQNDSSEGRVVFTATSSYMKTKSENFEPVDSSRKFEITAEAGTVLHFILFDLVEGSAIAPVPTIVSGTAAIGRLPTNFTTFGTSGGLSIQFFGAGSENGDPYFDIRWSGIASSASTQLFFEGGSYIAAGVGQGWGLNVPLKLIDGSLSSGFQLDYKLFAAGGTYLGERARAAQSVTTNKLNYQHKLVASESNLAAISPGFYRNLTVSFFYDYTLRIFRPACVQISVVEGDELNMDAGFDNPANWNTSDASISMSGGAVNYSSTPDGGSAYVVRSATPGTIQKTSVVVSSLSSGSLQSSVNGNVNSMPSAGAYVSYGAATAGSTVGIYATGATTAVVSSFSVKVVTPGYLPDYPILPPVGSLVDSLCAGDLVVAESPDWVADFEPAVGLSELVVVDLSHIGDGVVRPLFEVSDGTTNNFIKAYIDENDCPVLEIVSGNVLQELATLPFSVVSGLSLLAFGWSADGGFVTDQNGNVVSFGAIALPADLAYLQLGGDSSSNFLNDWLIQVQICSPLSLSESRAWMDHQKV